MLDVHLVHIPVRWIDERKIWLSRCLERGGKLPVDRMTGAGVVREWVEEDTLDRVTRQQAEAVWGRHFSEVKAQLDRLEGEGRSPFEFRMEGGTSHYSVRFRREGFLRDGSEVGRFHYTAIGDYDVFLVDLNGEIQGLGRAKSIHSAIALVDEGVQREWATSTGPNRFPPPLPCS